MLCLEEVALGNSTKDTDSHARDEKSTENGLDEDRVLNLAKSRLLDPDLTVKDLANKVALFVACNPWLVFVRIARCVKFYALGRLGFDLFGLQFIVRGKKLPRSEMSVMHAVQHHTHAFPCCDQGGDADEKTNQRHDTPCTTSTAKSENDCSNETGDDAADTETTCKDDTGTVAVADGPANKVGMCLATKRPFDRRDDVVEGRWMCRVLESMQQRSVLLGREVQLARSIIGNVDGDDTIDLFSVRLDGDCGG